MILPYQDRYRVKVPDTKPVHKGLDKIFHQLIWRLKQPTLSSHRIFKVARKLVAKSLTLTELSDDELTGQFRQAWDQKNLKRLITLLCEISQRTLNMRPHPNQITLVLVMQKGAIAEMATGEGKTLSAAISAILFALDKKPVHVLTSNDYLAERDAQETQPLYARCDLTVASIGSDMDPNQRRQVYQCDIVYATAKELLADYLKDRIKIGQNSGDLKRAVDFSLGQLEDLDIVLRGLHGVVIDEADNILIDEAVIPLILTAPRRNQMVVDAAIAANTYVGKLKKDVDYHASLLERRIYWTRKGEKKLSDISRKLPKIWSGEERTRELMNTALVAREFHIKDEHYVIQDDKIVLIDVLTGRLTPMRNLGIGLQQAVEAKEGLELSDPSEVIARMSFQKFFRMFPKIGGMSGTVKEVASELWNIYHLLVVGIPTHRKIKRIQRPWAFTSSEADKYLSIMLEIRTAWIKKQPILLGTRSVEISETLATMLKSDGIPCQVLNAVRHKEEAQIVANAGLEGHVTIATNMAGRGTDIKLVKEVKDRGGLLVICVEPQSSGRLDRQLFGRSGRQGDPGVAVGFSCPEDPLVKRFVPRWLLPLVSILFRFPWLGKQFILTRFIKRLQQRSEKHSGKQRLAILRSDDWMEEHVTFPGGNT